MQRMIDLHCHILPGIDDGAKTMTDALAMAEAAVESGITHILCTPHHRNGKYLNPKYEVIQAVADLQARLDEEGIPLTVFEGQEIRVTGELLTDRESGQLLGTDTEDRYLLMEFPSIEIPYFAESLFLTLIGEGVTPVIVHPERNGGFIEDPNALIPFLEMGCLAQLTAPSYVGVFGKKIQKTAKQMVKHGLVQCVASDAHNLKGRKFYLAEAYNAIRKDFGTEKERYFKEVSKNMINGDDIHVAPYSPVKTGFLGLFD